MEMTVEDTGPFLRIRLHGHLTSATGASIYDAVLGVAMRATGRVVLDLAHLDGITRAGCRVIFVAAVLLNKKGGRMAACNLSSSVASVLGGSGFDHVMPVCRDEVGAIQRLFPDVRSDESEFRRAA